MLLPTTQATQATKEQSKIKSDDELIQMLSEATELKHQTSETNFDFIEYEKPQYNNSDFSEPISEPIETKISETEVKMSKGEYLNQAELVIAFADGLSVITFPALYKKSLFSKQEKQDLISIKIKEILELNETEKELLNREKECNELIKAIPFSQDEVELLKSPLANVFEKYNVKASPEILLLGALFTVMAPRLIPLLHRIERKL
jgi:hypothetical protein